ncbi:DUF6515 family protein [Robertkochia sediminum]|uniref:DUF6515 family protein n=1 Tax=Robertkochia sediminum TaxID=2785326 RepID=UPI00193272A6|nr:DUF6515 family protein [Robertkochia sediminum]MBL7471174.1 hypothetical protein [Robertkochia sediminum]
MNRPDAFFFKVFFVTMLFFMASVPEAEAQRMRHPASKSTISRPASTPSRPAARPTTQRPQRSGNTSGRTTSSRPNTYDQGSINGGYKRATSRTASRIPATQPKKQTRPVRQPSTINRDGRNNTYDRGRVSRVSRPVQRPDKNYGRNPNYRVDNRYKNNRYRRYHYVRPSYRPYYRPPYIWGNYYFYSHRPYWYHPYRPYYWGSIRRPLGFFITTLAATAIIVSITNDNNDDRYYYDDGHFYIPADNGYRLVEAPVGARVQSIPDSAERVQVTENTYNYYYGGSYFEENEDGYVVVPATAGTIVPHLPDGGEEVRIGDRTYVRFGETYYQPIQLDGKNMYEIVEMEETGN